MTMRARIDAPPRGCPRPVQRGGALVGAVLGIVFSAGCAGLAEEGGAAPAPGCVAPGQTLIATPLGSYRTGPSADSAGAMLSLVHPAQIAVSGDDLFVADQGLGQLVRVQRAAQSFRAVGRLPGRVTGLYIDPFRRLFLAVPSISAVLQVSTDGATERVLRDAANLATPLDVALDRGQSVYAVDGSDARVIVFDRLGQSTGAVGERLDTANPFATTDAVAAGEHGVYVLDATQRRVHLLRDGAVSASMALGDSVRAPSALAVDRWDRVFVLDPGGRQVVMLTGVMSQPPVAVSNLGMTQAPLDLWVDDMGDLYLAEPGGVRAFRLPPPCGK